MAEEPVAEEPTAEDNDSMLSIDEAFEDEEIFEISPEASDEAAEDIDNLESGFSKQNNRQQEADESEISDEQPEFFLEETPVEEKKEQSFATASEEILPEEVTPGAPAEDQFNSGSSDQLSDVFSDIEEEDEDEVFLDSVQLQERNPEQDDFEQEFNRVVSEEFESNEEQDIEQISLEKPEESLSEPRIIPDEESEEEESFEVDNTQVFSKEMFSGGDTAGKDGMEQPLNNLDENPLYPVQDQQRDDELVFEDSDGVDVAKDNPQNDTFEIESSEFFLENESQEQQQSKKKSSDSDDSLITGDDVIKKMDNFFGFDKN